MLGKAFELVESTLEVVHAKRDLLAQLLALNQQPSKVTREHLPDGSAVVTYEDGSMLTLESDLAKESVLREPRPTNYNKPAPPPKEMKD